MRIKSFRNEKRKQYYFRVFNNNDEIVLRSEAYNSKSARDNGIKSLKTNAAIPERYERLVAANGKQYFNVKAANHQVVATSAMFDTEGERENAIAQIIAYASSAKGKSKSTAPQNIATTTDASTMTAANLSKANDGDGKEQDDYMNVDFYQNSGTNTQSGFDKFQKGDSNFYFFSFKSDDGKVILLSQGYTAEAGRDNGIASVEKNSKIEKRYSNNTTDDGKHYFILKAGNHQEIARSVDFDSEDEMKRAITIMMNGGGSLTPVKMSTTKDSSASNKEDDDYKTADFYQNSGTETKGGFDKFQKGDNNFYYFSFQGLAGNVLLLSQGYTQEAGRDNGISSVEKNSKIEKRYKTHTTDSGKWFFTLKAGNHQEIAKSIDG